MSALIGQGERGGDSSRASRCERVKREWTFGKSNVTGDELDRVDTSLLLPSFCTFVHRRSPFTFRTRLFEISRLYYLLFTSEIPRRPSQGIMTQPRLRRLRPSVTPSPSRFKFFNFKSRQESGWREICRDKFYDALSRNILETFDS